METYIRLADDSRAFILVLGVFLVIINRKSLRTMATPWVGAALVLFGLTTFIPNKES